MKVKVVLEFNSPEEAADYLAGKEVVISTSPQTYEATQHPVAQSPAQKAAATKAKKAAALGPAAVMPSQPSAVPTSAFPAPPAQPLNPIQMPGLPPGMPAPSGMPQVNYGQPMQQPPQHMAPPVQQPVQQPPVQQAWDRAAVIANVQATAEQSGQSKAVITKLFGEIFQENGIVPAQVGQLTDHDLYNFQLAFYPKMAALRSNPNHLA